MLAKQKAEEEAVLAKQKAEEEAALAKQKAEEEAALANQKADQEALFAKMHAEFMLVVDKNCTFGQSKMVNSEKMYATLAPRVQKYHDELCVRVDGCI